MNTLTSTAIIGIGATALIDAWAIMRTPLLSVPPPDYGLVGRWLAHILLMQPGIGAGIAASRTPNPTAARLHSVLMHAIFGLGLFASGWAVSRFFTH